MAKFESESLLSYSLIRVPDGIFRIPGRQGGIMNYICINLDD